jgi:hypothetical protein
MKKLATLSLIGLFCMCFNNTNAQVLSGVNVGMFKPFTEGSKTQFGFSLVGKYNINEKIRVGANLGYYFSSEDVMGSKIVAFTRPYTALFEYSFSDNDFSPYAGADIGIYQMGASGGGVTLAKGYLGLAPVAGLNYNLSDKLLLNGNLKFHYILSEGKSTSAIGINVGLAYKF